MASDGTPMKRKSGGRQHPEVPTNEKITAGEYNVGAYNLDTLKLYYDRAKQRYEDLIKGYDDFNKQMVEDFYMEFLTQRKVSDDYSILNWEDSYNFGGTLEIIGKVFATYTTASGHGEVSSPFGDANGNNIKGDRPTVLCFSPVYEGQENSFFTFRYFYQPREIIDIPFGSGGNKAHIYVAYYSLPYGYARQNDGTAKPGYFSTKMIEDNDLPNANNPYGTIYCVSETKNSAANTFYKYIFPIFTVQNIQDNTHGMQPMYYYGKE